MADKTQQEILRIAKNALGAQTWDEFASMVGIKPRALKTYLLPSTSSGHRTMPAVAHKCIETLLEAKQSKKRKAVTWPPGAA